MAKDNFISMVGLWPKNRALPIYEKGWMTVSHYSDVDEHIIALPQLTNTIKCLYSDSKRCKNQRASSMKSRERFHLISSLSSISRKKHANLQYINEKHREMINDEEKLEEKHIKMNNNAGKIKILTLKSFYRLDMTSPLGQVVIRNFKNDAGYHVVSEVKSHISASNNSVEPIRLRERPNTYPVTFKGFSGKSSSHVHMYSFTRRQKVEFMRRVNTGLDKRSRLLLKKMRPCKVRLSQINKVDLKKWVLSNNEMEVTLKPLSLEEIAYWTSPKTVARTNSSAALVIKISQPSNKMLNFRTQDVPLYVLQHSENMFVGEQISPETTTCRGCHHTSSVSDFIRTENRLPETSSVLIPQVPILTLQQMLLSASGRYANKMQQLLVSASGRYTHQLQQIHSLTNITDIDFDFIFNMIKYHSLCHVSTMPLKPASGMGQIKTSSYLQNKYSHYHQVLNFLISHFSNYSRISL